MTLEQKMLAVVEAARASVARWRDFSDNELSDGTVNLRQALAALDAHTEAGAETVEVRAKIWQWPNSTDLIVTADHIDLPYPLAATLIARIPLPAVPTITATVTREAGR